MDQQGSLNQRQGCRPSIIRHCHLSACFEVTSTEGERNEEGTPALNRASALKAACLRWIAKCLQIPLQQALMHKFLAKTLLFLSTDIIYVSISLNVGLAMS